MRPCGHAAIPPCDMGTRCRMLPVTRQFKFVVEESTYLCRQNNKNNAWWEMTALGRDCVLHNCRQASPELHQRRQLPVHGQTTSAETAPSGRQRPRARLPSFPVSKASNPFPPHLNSYPILVAPRFCFTASFYPRVNGPTGGHSLNTAAPVPSGVCLRCTLRR